MWRILSVIFIGFCLISPSGGQDCSSISFSMKLPKKVKTRGKLKIAKWEDIDKILNNLKENLQGHACSYRFDELFKVGKEKDSPFFPLTNSGVRLIPEDSLMGLNVYSDDGEFLGTYAGRIKFEKSGNLYAKKSYTVYYFQYKNADGKLQSVGSELLLDRFLLNWKEIKNIIAVSTMGVD